MSTRIY